MNYTNIVANIMVCIIIFATTTAFAELIDIGQNRKIYLECQGSGSPSVVFISGRGNSSDIWKTTNSGDSKQNVFERVAKFTHACTYDRPGTFAFIGKESAVPGQSTPYNRSVTPKDGVDELHAALTAAKVPPPYVLVAHSYGGLIARLFASIFPNEVAGLVLIDTATEIMYDDLTPKDQALWIRITDTYSAELDRIALQERIDFILGFEQLRKAPLPKKMPVVVLASDQTYDMKGLIEQGVLPADSPVEFGALVFKIHLKAQQKLAEIYGAKLVTNTHAGHYIQTEQPELVVEAIHEVVENVRKVK